MNLIIKCEKCGTAYKIDEKILKVQGTKFRCAKCKEGFRVQLPDLLYEHLEKADSSIDHRDCSTAELIEKIEEPAASFARYLISRNSSSYKPVLALIFLKNMDKEGAVDRKVLSEQFYEYYLARKKEGIVVEAESVLISKIDEIDPKKITSRSLAEPLKSFFKSGYFERISGKKEYKLSQNIYYHLKDSNQKFNIEIILLKCIEEYFNRISRTEKILDDNKNSIYNQLYEDINNGKIREEDNGGYSLTVKKRKKSKIII